MYAVAPSSGTRIEPTRRSQWQITKKRITAKIRDTRTNNPERMNRNPRRRFPTRRVLLRTAKAMTSSRRSKEKKAASGTLPDIRSSNLGSRPKLAGIPLGRNLAHQSPPNNHGVQLDGGLRSRSQGYARGEQRSPEIGMSKWRRDRDSNPGYPFEYTRFPSVRLQPLGHLSVREAQVDELLQHQRFFIVAYRVPASSGAAGTRRERTSCYSSSFNCCAR